MTTSIQNEDELLKAGIFSLEDIEVNRSGQLSERQKRRLTGRLTFWFGLTAFCITVLAAFVYFQVKWQGNILLGIAGIAYLFILISSSLQEAQRFQDDLRTDMVKTVSGPLHKGYGSSSGIGTMRGSILGHCNLQVREQIFSISPAVYERVYEDGSYRIYYVENTRTIVNIEPL